VVIAVLLGIGALSSRNNATAEKSGGQHVSKKLIQQKNRLLTEIASLDDHYALKRIREKEYRQRRGRLKARLTEIYRKTESNT